jgi:hypothetical protein
MLEAWITVLSCRSRNISQKERIGSEGRRRYHINTRASDTDTHVTLGVGSTVLSSRQRNISLEWRERLRRRKNVLSLDSVRKDGRMLDSFYVIICTNAMHLQVQFIIYSLPVLSGFHFHTHAFRSLLRAFYALRTVHVTPVTSHQLAPHHGYNALAGECGASSHLLRTNRHSSPTK